MSKLVLVTGNPGKAGEIASVLRGYDVEIETVEVDLSERRADGVEEIAREKALEARQHVGRPLIVDDTGLFLEAYPDFPGAQSKWVVQRIGLDGIFRLLEGRSRAAYFKTAVAFAEPAGRPQVFTGVVEGELRAERGPDSEPSLPYDPAFAPQEGGGRVYSEMELEEKLAHSSRARAVRAFAEWWLERATR